MTNAVETTGLSYSPGGGFTISDLNFAMPTGSVYGFLGPNGSGKTTTIRLLLGMLRQRAGTIRVLDGQMPRDASRLLARIGYVPEQPHFDPTQTIGEILSFQAAFFPTWDHAFALRQLDDFELEAKKPFGSLSKGMKAKVMMLTALAQRPELLVLDEPTDGLDPVARRDILASLLEYVGERQASVLISSHLVHELERICDWIGVMDAGRLVLQVPMQRFKQGMKRLRLTAVAPELPPAPFVRMSREAVGRSETWIVRDWEPGMTEYFNGRTATLTEVQDLDLEDGFVELLRAFRAERRRAE
jgi:ABC-2 type transport system ATP-binding protein